VLAAPAGAGARSFEVTKKGDPAPGECTAADCSLREAVLAANARAGADRIVLPGRKYRLSIPSTAEDGAMDGDLDVTNDPLAFRHPGKGKARINANAIDRVFEVFTGAPARFTKIVVQGGDIPSGPNGDGGGIRSTANLTLNRSAVKGNRAVGAEPDGGGIAIAPDSGASLTLRRSVVAGNFSEDDGGGLSFEEDSGDEGRLTVVESVIRGNSSDGYAAGAFVRRPATIKKTTVVGNRSLDSYAGGLGIENSGRVKVVGTTISGNSSAAGGGGVEMNGSVEAVFVNVTIAGNRTESSGGGILNGGGVVSARLNAVTVARNVADTDGSGDLGGGLAGGDPLSLDNTLLAKNRAFGGRDNCDGTGYVSGGHNLADEASDCGLTGPGDRNKPAKIGPLADNGGPTKTIGLKPRSKAINKAGNDAPNRDQRGVKRQNPDIGAYERD
jgi:CSLREA domain-containing protein